MLTREEIRAVYDQGPEAVIALVEQLCAQIAELAAQVKEEDLTLEIRHAWITVYGMITETMIDAAED
jgi:hemoglobin-like flavoprotein